MKRCSLKEGIAFVILMLSSSVMDSEDLIIPMAGCILSALLLLSASKKKDPATDQSYRI